MKGNRGPTGENSDPKKQPDPKLRALDVQPTAPGPRDEVYCTKIGTTRPDEMYIVSGHMDGIGYGAAADDNGSGAALVMELARIFSAPDVQTDRSIRFILWNNEETGLNGAHAYVDQRGPLQGKEDPPGSGKYPEPKWLGMIAHDMMLFDHGMPGPDGKVSPEQRPEADVNVEFAATTTGGSPSKMAAAAQELAWAFRAANDRYATDYAAVVGNRMSNTDSAAFQDDRAIAQPARSRTPVPGGRRLEPAVAPADRPLRDVLGQGLPAWSERGADDAGRHRATDRSEGEITESEIQAHWKLARAARGLTHSQEFLPLKASSDSIERDSPQYFCALFG